MTPKIVDQLNIAREVMQRHPLYHVEPGYRYAIYAAMGPRLETITPTLQRPELGIYAVSDTSGVRRRAWLGILTVRKVLPIWESLWPIAHVGKDNYPHRFLAFAEGAFSGVYSYEFLKEQLDTWYKVEFSDSRYKMIERHIGDSNVASRICNMEHCAYTALCVVISDEDFDPVNIDFREQDLDPWTFDVAHHASVAYAGEVWAPTLDIHKNREFWTWWLDEAVPTAYSMVREPSTS